MDEKANARIVSTSNCDNPLNAIAISSNNSSLISPKEEYSCKNSKITVLISSVLKYASCNSVTYFSSSFGIFTIGETNINVVSNLPASIRKQAFLNNAIILGFSK